MVREDGHLVDQNMTEYGLITQFGQIQGTDSRQSRMEVYEIEKRPVGKHSEEAPAPHSTAISPNQSAEGTRRTPNGISPWRPISGETPASNINLLSENDLSSLNQTNSESDLNQAMPSFDHEIQAFITIRKQEAFARGFEMYLNEGKAPNKALRGVFLNMVEWFKKIYKMAMSFGVELNAEIRGVFDRMLASDTSIEYSDNLHAQYRSELQKIGLDEESVSELETLREKMISDAQSVQFEKIQREIANMEGDIRDRAENDVFSRPEYRVIAALDDIKLDDVIMRELVSPEQYTELEVRGYLSHNDESYHHPDDLAELGGYPDMESMLDAILSAPEAEYQIQEVMGLKKSRIMSEMSTSQSLESMLGTDSFSNYQQKISEFYAKRNQNDRNKYTNQILRAMAEHQIKKQTIDEIQKTYRYLQDFTRLHRMEETALLKNDIVAAAELHLLKRIAEHKIKLSHQLSKKNERQDRWITQRANAQSKVSNRKDISPDYSNAIMRLASRFGLISATVTGEVKQGKYDGESIAVLVSSEVQTEKITFGDKEEPNEIGNLIHENQSNNLWDNRFLDESYRSDYRTLTLNEFNELRELINYLHERGKVSAGILEGLGGIHLDDAAVEANQIQLKKNQKISTENIYAHFYRSDTRTFCAVGFDRTHDTIHERI